MCLAGGPSQVRLSEPAEKQAPAAEGKHQRSEQRTQDPKPSTSSDGCQVRNAIKEEEMAMALGPASSKQRSHKSKSK